MVPDKVSLQLLPKISLKVHFLRLKIVTTSNIKTAKMTRIQIVFLLHF